ncbi:hypothetical protein K466DRAFT_364512 [Polyporus arcularius HHB13444]|uniref:Heterokaryon incompatibility domain-containing protein n=1 Tax=Polyporus arcularius HHB13444 TaxID=1314778 RepID=A0A5C3NUY2_9APHY|nr:hypothetical protein K466DRAFT_364512 [Polyporus arcularius HHB13444]
MSPPRSFFIPAQQPYSIQPAQLTVLRVYLSKHSGASMKWLNWRWLLGNIAEDGESTFTDDEDGLEDSDSASEDGDAALEARARSQSAAGKSTASDAEADNMTSDDDCTSANDDSTSGDDDSASEDANPASEAAPTSTLVVHLYLDVTIGTAGYCHRTSLSRCPALSSITSPKELQWYHLWSSISAPKHVFLVDGTSREFSLYQDALRVLRTEFVLPLAFSNDTYSNNMLAEKVSPSFLATHESWGVLVNLLGDRYRLPMDWYDGTSVIRETLSLSSTVDFILSGLLHISALIRREQLPGPPLTLDFLRRCHPCRDFEEFAHEAIFFDLMYQLWTMECAMRCTTKWSPMPWSEMSSQEASGPLGTASQCSPFPPSFRVPSAEELDVWAARDHNTTALEVTGVTYGYPPDVPWFGAPHDGYPVASTLSSYVTIRRSTSTYRHALEEDFALWLSALTFGILEIMTGSHVSEATLLVSAGGPGGQRVLSGTNLLRLMCVCTFHWENQSSRDPAVKPGGKDMAGRVAQSFEQACMALVEEGTSALCLFNRAFGSASNGAHHRDEILGAIYLTVISLRALARGWWPELPWTQDLPISSGTAIGAHRVALGWALGSSGVNMQRAGWCPSVITDTTLGLYSRELGVLSQIARLKPYIRDNVDEHRSCTANACVLMAVDLDHYTPHHVDPSCTCDFIRPTPGAVEQHLSVGDIPVVVYEGSQLTVRRSSDGPYVAISHVWADGLGSVTEDGLPACQLARLSALVATLEPSAATFWMDSLCIPRGEPDCPLKLRKRAIKLMARVYKEATSVLVTDSAIRTQCSTSSPMWDYLFRISVSGWMRRVWTLQEGLLAQRVYFEFKDGILVDIEENLATFALATAVDPSPAALAQFLLDRGVVESLPLSPAFLLAYLSQGVLPEQYRQIVPLFGYKRDRYGRASGIATTLGDAIILLRGRTTSKAEDETLAISGLFPASVDVGPLYDIKSDEGGACASQRRMALFLTQVREVSKELPWLESGRLSLPNFRWAPATLAGVGGTSFSGTATCTADGLLGEYVVGHFLPAILIQYSDEELSRDEALEHSFILEHAGRTYTVSLKIPMQHLSGLRIVYKDDHKHVAINSILLKDDPFPQGIADFRHFAAVQHMERGGDGRRDESVPIHCDFVACGCIWPLSQDREEALSGMKTVRHEIAKVSRSHVLLK